MRPEPADRTRNWKPDCLRMRVADRSHRQHDARGVDPPPYKLTITSRRRAPDRGRSPIVRAFPDLRGLLRNRAGSPPLRVLLAPEVPSEQRFLRRGVR